VPTLVLLRHAKSAYPDAVDDHERPLNERGRHDAPIAGLRLAETLSREGSTIDVALVSSAVRAQETWSLVSQHLTVADQRTRTDLYLADPDELLRIVRGLPASVDGALIVGHNNGLEDFVSTLAATSVTLKTSSFAVLVSAAPWEHWGEGRAELVEVVIAR
jgi:phosphohistidine phosphatase